jgi:serine/threonine protein kinase
MELIDEGGFGCVFRPPLECTNGSPVNNSMVSKLQPEKYGKYEMKQIDKLKKICKKHISKCDKYFILDVNMCTPKLKKNIDNQQCYLLENNSIQTTTKITKGKYKTSNSKNKTKKQNLNILNMPYMGINLHKYILYNIDFKDKDSFTKLNNSIIELYRNAIRILNNNNFYHNDIKTANILVDENKNLRLIDWGLANNIVFINKFIFNKPYMYILMTNYFLEKLVKIKSENKIITREIIEPVLLNYITLIKIKNSDNYLYTKEILEFMFPYQDNTSFKNPTNEIIHPLLYEHFIQLCLRFNNIEEWTKIYINNLDIVSIAIMYPDILCAIYIQKVNNVELSNSIIDFFRKYVLECYDPISQEDFIQDLEKLNMNVL